MWVGIKAVTVIGFIMVDTVLSRSEVQLRLWMALVWAGFGVCYRSFALPIAGLGVKAPKHQREA